MCGERSRFSSFVKKCINKPEFSKPLSKSSTSHNKVVGIYVACRIDRYHDHVCFVFPAHDYSLSISYYCCCNVHWCISYMHIYWSIWVKYGVDRCFSPWDGVSLACVIGTTVFFLSLEFLYAMHLPFVSEYFCFKMLPGLAYFLLVSLVMVSEYLLRA